MSTRKISAKEILADIRSGMDNTALMEKYKVSEQNLRVILKKLEQADLLPPAPVKEPAVRRAQPERTTQPTEASEDEETSAKKPLGERIRHLFLGERSSIASVIFSFLILAINLFFAYGVIVSVSKAWIMKPDLPSWATVAWYIGRVVGTLTLVCGYLAGLLFSAFLVWSIHEKIDGPSELGLPPVSFSRLIYIIFILLFIGAATFNMWEAWLDVGYEGERSWLIQRVVGTAVLAAVLGFLAFIGWLVVGWIEDKRK